LALALPISLCAGHCKQSVGLIVAEGRKYFRDFLRTEFSEENVLFWLACEELKRETNAELIEEKARSIYEDYISILSPKEVRFSLIDSCHSRGVYKGGVGANCLLSCRGELYQGANILHSRSVAALHQGAPCQMTWLEDPPPWLPPWLRPACCFALLR